MPPWCCGAGAVRSHSWGSRSRCQRGAPLLGTLLHFQCTALLTPLLTNRHPSPEIHNIVGAGKSDGAMDASNLLKPMLARGEVSYLV